MPENNQMMSVEGQLVGMPLAGPESFSQQQLDYLKRAMGIDETVLYDGNGSTTNNASLSESPFNFERLDIIVGDSSGNYEPVKISMITKEYSGSNYFTTTYASGLLNSYIIVIRFTLSTTGISVTKEVDYKVSFDSGTSATIAHNTATFMNCIYKVVGIHRIAGGNQ